MSSLRRSLIASSVSLTRSAFASLSQRPAPARGGGAYKEGLMKLVVLCPRPYCGGRVFYDDGEFFCLLCGRTWPARTREG